MRAHIVFNGPSRLLKLYVVGESQPRHTLICHDVGVKDGTLPDPYGHDCKCPPGLYFVGAPQTLNPPEAAYGFHFTPLYDAPPDFAFAQHGRAGIGVHGGGSDLPNPFAPQQGWEWTFGCLRLQNADNQTFVEFVRYVQKNSDDPQHCVTLSVWWGDRAA